MFFVVANVDVIVAADSCGQKFVAQLTTIPNLKIDYVVLNAGVLRYPNVGYNHYSHGLADFGRERLSCTFGQLPDTLLCAMCSSTYMQHRCMKADRRRSSFDEFAFHLHTNTIGPIITAQKLLQTNIPIGTIVFMSSDSGSQGNFREMEDGFAAYAASKAALNMAVRHMAAELKRKDDDTILIAMHPGEVQT